MNGPTAAPLALADARQSLIKCIVEAAILAAEEPLSIKRLQGLFVEEAEPPSEAELHAVIVALVADYVDRGVELKEVASGFRFQVRTAFTPWVGRLWEERPPRYSRALLETLALVAYRQPITRAEIEEIRGVSVNSQIVRTLLEREWIQVVGHREVPGHPALLGTTQKFLDYFNLGSLADLPPLHELESETTAAQPPPVGIDPDLADPSLADPPLADPPLVEDTPGQELAATDDPVATVKVPLGTDDPPTNLDWDEPTPFADDEGAPPR